MSCDDDNDFKLLIINYLFNKYLVFFYILYLNSMVNFNDEIDEIILLNKNINYHLTQHGGSNKII